MLKQVKIFTVAILVLGFAQLSLAQRPDFEYKVHNVGNVWTATSNFGNYDQSANLVQQWKLGNSSVDANIGHSFVTSGGVNVSDNAVGVTSADVVSF